MATARKAQLSDDEWMTLEEASQALGVSRLATTTLIIKGELVGQHVAKRTIVRRDTVDALIAARAVAGVASE